MNKQEDFSIKKAADLVGVNPSTLRYWEQAGLISIQRDKENEYRRFSIHNLIEASELLFYRNLGVPIKTLKNYRELSVEAFEDILADTQQKVEEQIEYLKTIRSRLILQRELNETVLELESKPLKPGIPSFTILTELDYEAPDQWNLVAEAPQHYGILIDRARPDIAIEAIADSPHHKNERLLWARESAQPYHYLEGLLKIDTELQSSNAVELFSEAEQLGCTPLRLVGAYLVTATDGIRWDYYHAWIECTHS